MESGDRVWMCIFQRTMLFMDKKVRSLYSSSLRKISYSGMNSFNEQASIDIYPSAEVAEYPRAWFNDAVLDWPMGISQMTPGDAFTSHALLAAPDLSGTYGSGSVWSGDLGLSCPSVMSTSNYWQNDTDIHNIPVFDQLLPSNATTELSQLYAPHYVPACAGVTNTTIGGNPISYPVQKNCSVRKPIGGLAGKHISASRTTTRSRHTPYPLARDAADNAERGSLTASFHLVCQWTNGAIPCGATVAGTKKAVGQHLHAAHGIRLKPDMTVCLWGECRKSMRRESIPRHVLAVHMKDKVHCTGCGSYFARQDSLQRHQRTCLDKVRGENTSEACKVGGETRFL